MSSGGFKSTVDFVVRIGGEAGEGVVSCGELFAQAAARTEYHVFSYPTYPAEIRGGFSMIQIRIRDWTVYSMGSRVDYLIVFNQQAYDRTVQDLKPGGTIIYDPDEVRVVDGLDARKFLRLLRVTDLFEGGSPRKLRGGGGGWMARGRCCGGETAWILFSNNRIKRHEFWRV